MKGKERAERRNLIIKGTEVKDGKRMEAVEELFREIGVEVEVKEVRKIGGEGKKGGETLWVRRGTRNREGRYGREKKHLKGRRERVLEDWTWKERRMRWRLDEIAWAEKKKGKKVWIGYGRIKIEEMWWKWDEVEEVLKDEKRNKWGMEQREAEKTKKRGVGKV